MRRTMHVLEGQGPQEAFHYDHPFFGQIVLAGALQLIGYPDSLNPTADPSSIETLYLAPRIFMGLLAVLDTFLIYNITEKKFGKKTAIIASVLFAVMPISWLFRRILLDSLLLPFLLSAILLAIYSKDSKNKNILVFSSGITLGLSIFTKIPIITMIPLVLFLIYSNNKKLKDVAFWLIPVIAIPLIWPAYSLVVGQFDLWINDVLWQTQRIGQNLFESTAYILDVDFLLFYLGIAGIVFAIIRRDVFTMLWFFPLLILLFAVGYAQYFHWIPLVPILCISIAVLVVELSKKINRKKLRQTCPVIITLSIAIFGLTSTTILITTDVSQSQFDAASFVLQKTDDDVTILASPVYSWIFSDVFDRPNVLSDYSLVLFEPIPEGKILLIADTHFMIDTNRGKQIQTVYEMTSIIKEFDGNVANYDTSIYPYGSMKINVEGYKIEIRTNED